MTIYKKLHLCKALVMTRNKHSGFTLIELSIVVIIVGLIAGGYFAVTEMRHTAKLRAQLSQVEEYARAIKAFETKYNCVPGDCRKAVARGLGTTANHNGNGDGIVGTTGVFAACLHGTNWREVMNLPMHLQKAGFIKADVDFEGHIGEGHNSCMTTTKAQKKLLPSPLHKDAFIIAAQVENVRSWGQDTYGPYLRRAGKAIGVVGLSGSWSFSPKILHTDSQYIDDKIDDGKPLTGNVGLAPIGAPWGGLIPKAKVGGGHNCITSTYKAIIENCGSSHGGSRGLLIFLHQY